MKHLSRPFIAIVAALLLVLAQQGALAHMIGHAAGGGGETQMQRGDEQHGAAQSLSHLCTTCVAFAALDAYLPTLALPLGSAERPVITTAVVAFARRGEAPLHQRARAPPSPL